MLEPFPHIRHFQHMLFLVQLERHVRGDSIRKSAWVIDARKRGENLRRDLFVQFDVLIEKRSR